MSVRQTLQYIFSKDVGNYIMSFTHDDYFTIKICGYAKSIFHNFETRFLFEMDPYEYEKGSSNKFKVYYFEADAERKITKALNCNYQTFWSSYILTDRYVDLTNNFLQDNSTIEELSEKLELVYRMLNTKSGHRQVRQYSSQQYSHSAKPRLDILQTSGHYLGNEYSKEPIDYMDISTNDFIGSYHNTTICYYDNGVYQGIPIYAEDPFLRNIFAIANVNY